jgi:hypothetical protein
MSDRIGRNQKARRNVCRRSESHARVRSSTPGRRRSIRSLHVTACFPLPFDEPGYSAAPFGPAFNHSLDRSGCTSFPEQGQQLLTGGPRPLGQHLDAPVLEVSRPPGKTELKGPRPGPPPEADALYPPAHPSRDPRPVRQLRMLLFGRAMLGRCRGGVR